MDIQENLFPLAYSQHVPKEDREALGIEGLYISAFSKKIMAVFTGEKRCPKAGEWFLSGAVVEAYRTKNDLDTPYYIASLVRTELVQFRKITAMI